MAHLIGRALRLPVARAMAARSVPQPVMLMQADRGSLASSQLGVTRDMTSVRRRSSSQGRRARSAQIWQVSDHKWYLYARDMVEVFSGHRHQPDTSMGKGQILRVMREKNQVIVQGVNMKNTREAEGKYGGERRWSTRTRSGRPVIQKSNMSQHCISRS